MRRPYVGRRVARDPKRLDVERVHLDRGGYDRQGRYYGTGEKLYEVTTDGGESTRVRAPSANAALSRVAKERGWTVAPRVKATRVSSDARTRFQQALAHAKAAHAALHGVNRHTSNEHGTRAYWHALEKETRAVADAYDVAADAAEAQGGVTALRTAAKLRKDAAKLRTVYADAYRRYGQEAVRDPRRLVRSRSRRTRRGR